MYPPAVREPYLAHTSPLRTHFSLFTTLSDDWLHLAPLVKSSDVMAHMQAAIILAADADSAAARRGRAMMFRRQGGIALLLQLATSPHGVTQRLVSSALARLLNHTSKMGQLPRASFIADGGIAIVSPLLSSTHDSAREQAMFLCAELARFPQFAAELARALPTSVIIANAGSDRSKNERIQSLNVLKFLTWQPELVPVLVDGGIAQCYVKTLEDRNLPIFNGKNAGCAKRIAVAGLVALLAHESLREKLVTLIPRATIRTILTQRDDLASAYHATWIMGFLNEYSIAHTSTAAGGTRPQTATAEQFVHYLQRINSNNECKDEIEVRIFECVRFSLKSAPMVST